jgi:hypothetical protein
VPSFILETYVPRLSPDDLERLAKRAERATLGTQVDHVRSYLIPEDDMCMHVFEAPSLAAVRDLADGAGIEAERIVHTVGETADPPTRRST